MSAIAEFLVTKTDGEQPKGHLGQNSKTEEEEEEDYDDDDDDDRVVFSTLMLLIPKTC